MEFLDAVARLFLVGGIVFVVLYIVDGLVSTWHWRSQIKRASKLERRIE